MPTQIALLGGSFNPPHVGHMLAAAYVRSCLAIDQVWLVPSFHHPFGKALASFEARVAMCEAVAAALGPWLSVSQAEREVGGEGRTVDLLEYLVPRHPDVQFHFVIGSDILADVPKWKAWDRVQALAKVVVLHRAGYPDPRALGPPLAVVSSTDIRQRLETGRPVDDVVPAQVLAVARAAGLYGLR